MNVLLIISFYTATCAELGKSDPLPFSLSMVYLSHLAEREEQIYSQLKNQSNVKNRMIEIPSKVLVEEYMKDYEESSLVRGAWNIEHHHMLVYRMIWRFLYFIPQLQKHEESLGIHFGETDKLKYPMEENGAFDTTVEAIIDIQSTYRLHPLDLMHGKFGDIETTLGLNVNHAVKLAKTAFEMGYFVEAWEWLEHLEKLPILSSESKQEIELIMKNLKEEHDLNHQQKVTTGDPHIFTEPLQKEGTIRIWRKDQETQSWLTIGKNSGLAKEFYYRNYALCSNSSLLTVNPTTAQHQLKCYLDSSKPYFAVGPLKTEVLNADPEIHMFHDIVGKKLMAHMWDLSSNGMLIDALSPGEQAQAVLGSIHWLNETNFNECDRLLEKLEKVTGLYMRGDGSHKFRVSQYVLSGDIGVHHDAYSQGVPRGIIRPTFGDAIATVIIYMSEPILGGELVFPRLDLKIKPVKGAVIRWYNYKKDGSMDWRTTHGNCFTLLGQKRIATTLVHSRPNMFNRPCII